MTHSADPAMLAVPLLRTWIATLAVAVAAALIAWTAAEATRVDETGHGSKGGRIPVSPVVFNTQNGMVAFGTLGGALGLGLGLVGGLLRGSARSAGLAGAVGMVLGGSTGAGTAKLLIPFYFRNYSAESLSVPLLVHGGIWTTIAIAAGFAYGMGLGGPKRALQTLGYAILGAVIATFLYEFGGAVLFSSSQTDRPLPVSPGSRMFANLVIALFLAGALAFGVSRTQSSKAASAPIL